MPFVVVNVDEQQFAAVQSDFSGHSSIKNIGKLGDSSVSTIADLVEEDKEMRTQ